MTSSTPQINSVVMASRRYNAKRIVWEPFRVTGYRSDPNWPNQVRLIGVWLMDFVESWTYDDTKPFDPNWTAKKIAELEKETVQLDTMRHNLETLLANSS